MSLFNEGKWWRSCNDGAILRIFTSNRETQMLLYCNSCDVISDYHANFLSVGCISIIPVRSKLLAVVCHANVTGECC